MLKLLIKTRNGLVMYSYPRNFKTVINERLIIMSRMIIKNTKAGTQNENLLISLNFFFFFSLI